MGYANMAISKKPIPIGYFGMAFAIALICMMALRHYYTWNMLAAMDSAHNRTIPVNVNYNRVVYVTSGERNTFYAVHFFFALTAGVAVVAAALRK